MTAGMSWLDFKMGARMLIKYPGLAIVGGLGMAVAIAVSIGFFAFMSANGFPELPLAEGERIVALEIRDTEVNNEERRAVHDFVQWRTELKTVVNLGAFRDVTRNLAPGDGPPEPVKIAEITASGFDLARVPPLLGRYLVADDERLGAPLVLVIGHDVWKSRFNGDSTVVGRELRVGGFMHTVVGVMPEGFAFPMSHQYWRPLRLNPAAYKRREGPAIFIFGRLAPGKRMEDAQAELDVIGARTAAAFPETHAKIEPMVMPYVHSLTDIQGITRWVLVRMELMMNLLLVVVALNVAVLIYARTATRQGEIAVRTALGASRRRIVGQLFVEALVLSLGAAAVGLGIAEIGMQLGNRMMESEMGVPFWTNYRVQPSTLLLTMGLAVFAAVIVGILPALQATGRSLRNNLSQLSGGTGAQLGRTWTVLIVAQVAIAVAALPAAVTLGWNEIRGAMTRPTYRSEEFLTVEIAPEVVPEAVEGTDPRSRVVPFGDRLDALLHRLETEPSVAGVTYGVGLPDRGEIIDVEGVPALLESQAGHRVNTEGVRPNYFEVYGARVLTGRGFEAADADSAGTAVLVNQAFVRQVLGTKQALGRRIRHVTSDRTDSEVKYGPWYQIVGVTEDMQVNATDPNLLRPVLYYSVAPSRLQWANLEIRLRGATPADFAPKLREIAFALDPTLRLGTTYSLADFEEQDRLATRLVALIVGLVLVSVFLLSAAGVYALTSFTVTRRRREIGIRTALGALPGQVLRTIFARVALQIALGLVLGVVGAAGVDKLTGGELLGGRGGILLPIFGVMMTLVAALAAIGPARRGLSIEPTEALRAEG